jgi:hypothetical protein
MIKRFLNSSSLKIALDPKDSALPYLGLYISQHEIIDAEEEQ